MSFGLTSPQCVCSQWWPMINAGLFVVVGRINSVALIHGHEIWFEEILDTSTHLCRIIWLHGKAVLVDVKQKEATSGRLKGRDMTPFIVDGDDTATDTAGDTNDEIESFLDRVQYEELEPFDHWQQLTSNNRRQQKYQFMILGVGSMIGNDLHLSTLSLATEFIVNHEENPPRAIIIKSKTLNRLARRIVHCTFPTAYRWHHSITNKYQPKV